MTAHRDYYDILGIDKTADAAAIKKAYRKLAKKYHPDTNAGDKKAEQSFKEVTEAYTVLSDPEKKKLYDQFGQAGLDGNGPQPGGPQHGRSQSGGYTGGYTRPDGSYREYHFEGGDADDIFGDIFGDMMHGGKGRRSNARNFRSNGFYGGGFDQTAYKQNGADLHADISVSFDEAAFGCDKIIQLQNPNEAGSNVQSLQVHIPAGIENGKSIRLRDKGMPGANGGKAGALLLKVTVGKKRGFERKGLDVYTTVSIPFTTAVFGGEVTVPTIDGKVLCKIHEGTQSGTKIRLKGKGIVSMKNSSVHGNQFVTVQIQVPKNLGAEARQKLKEFEKAC